VPADFRHFCYATINDSEPVAASEEGEVHFPNQDVKTIGLLFEMAPEKRSVFKLADPKNNNFEFKFEPTIMEVIFDGLKLEFSEAKLKGSHPLLKPGIYNYEKLVRSGD
jgi:hypothetical protein